MFSEDQNVVGSGSNEISNEGKKQKKTAFKKSGTSESLGKSSNKSTTRNKNAQAKHARTYKKQRTLIGGGGLSPRRSVVTQLTLKSTFRGNMRKGTMYSKSNTVTINSASNPLNQITAQKFKAQKTQMLTTMNSIVEEEDEMVTEEEEEYSSTSSMQEEEFEDIEECKSEYEGSEFSTN